MCGTPLPSFKLINPFTSHVKVAISSPSPQKKTGTKLEMKKFHQEEEEEEEEEADDDTSLSELDGTLWWLINVYGPPHCHATTIFIIVRQKNWNQNIDWSSTTTMDRVADTHPQTSKIINFYDPFFFIIGLFFSALLKTSLFELVITAGFT